MTKKVTLCDRCGKEIPERQKHKYQLMSVTYSDGGKGAISDTTPVDLCEACYLDFEYFMTSFKSETTANPDLPLPDKTGEETDSKDKLKLIEKKLDQLEKDIRILELSRTIIETKPKYPWVTPPSISVYAGPELNLGPYCTSTSIPSYITKEGSDTNGDST